MVSAINEWYTFNAGTIDRKTCNKIKKHGSNWIDAKVNVKKEISKEERVLGCESEWKESNLLRVSDVSWITEQWIYDLVWPFMAEANEMAGWKYHIKAALSSQITRYRKGGFYSFHADGNGDHLSVIHSPGNEFIHGYVRKLSMSIILNDNFEGGAFEFASYGREECTITPVEAGAGSIIIFPSSMEHRVAPVTKGTRYSLVTWFVGPPFV